MTNDAIKFGKVANNPTTETSTIAGSIEMGIKNAPTRLIVSYLTKMYTYPLEAAIRETVSNAIDAAARKGCGTEAVEAEMFCDDSAGMYGSTNYVRVTDKGCGMNYDTLVNVYTQYGVSDKRDDADQTGAFGLGAKSPLAYNNELHIITRTAEEGTYYVHAYRTAADDFRADLPVKVEGSVEVTDNLAKADHDIDKTYTVTDPFEANETGTVVYFPLQYNDTNKASGIINAIDALMFHCGEGSITDGYINATPAYYKLGSFELRDGDGDTITATAYIADHYPNAETDTGYYPARPASTVISDLFASDNKVLNTSRVAFKVGDWLYPADGGSWHYDMRSYTCPTDDYAVIIDVPSKALPFVPSRDSIMADNNNANAKWLIAEISENIRGKFEDIDTLTEIFNWVCEKATTNSFPEKVRKLFPANEYRYEAADITAHKLTAVRLAYAYSLSLNLDKMEAIAGYTAWELFETAPAMIGYVEKNNNGDPKMKYGPAVCDANDVARLLGGNTRLDDSRSRAAGYGFAKTRKVADDVFADGSCKVNAVYHDKYLNERHASSGIDHVNANFPAALGMWQMFSECRMRSDSSAIVIIDGADYGLSKVRTGISYLFENLSILDNGSSRALFVVIPPKAEKTTWDADEKAAYKKMLMDVANAICKNVTYVEASELPTALTRSKTSTVRVNRSEFDRMFNMNRAVMVADVNGDGLYEYFNRSYENRKYEGLGRVIEADPSAWGVIVTDASKRSRSYEQGSLVARAACLLGGFSPVIENFAIIDSSHYNADRAKVLADAGVTVIYDESGITEDAVFAAEDFEITVNYGSGHLTYKGSVPTVVRSYMDEHARKDQDGTLAAAWTEGIRGGSYRYWGSSIGDNIRMSNMIPAFTFGHETYGVDMDSVNLPEWKKAIIASMSWGYEPEITAEGDTMETLRKKVREVAEIWRAVLSKSALSLELGELNDANYQAVAAAASAIGIEDAVHAYYAGVPMNDIIA